MVHVFECPNGHAIPDISGEPINGHVGYDERIYCPNCEKDVTGTYMGQSQEKIDDIQNKEPVDVELVERDGQPYCMECDGGCSKRD